MTFRFTPKTLFGATAMLALGASLAVAQDTSKTKPRSDRRIPISKEAPGEVVRTDTVMVYRTDTLQLTTRVVDTVRLTRTRVDTVIPKPPPIRLPNGFYAGASGGFSTPSGSLYVPNSTGGAAQIQLGWQRAKEVLGGRFDWNGAWPGFDSRFSAFQNRASIQNFNLDLKAQLPIPWFGSNSNTTSHTGDPCDPVTYKQGSVHRFSVYGIGGFTLSSYRNLPMRIDAQNLTVDNINDFNNLTFINAAGVVTTVNRDNLALIRNSNDFTNANVAFFEVGDSNWHSKGGWNAGGGVSMMWGRSELFVEARVLGFNPSHAPSARQVPVVFGMNWY